jgi:hypothetical protein
MGGWAASVRAEMAATCLTIEACGLRPAKPFATHDSPGRARSLENAPIRAVRCEFVACRLGAVVAEPFAFASIFGE